MKDITIKITGRQYIGEDAEEMLEFVTDGKMSERNGSLYLIYEESEVSGFPGYKTMLKLNGNTVSMKRINEEGRIGTDMVFRKGERFTDKYKTPYGVFDLEVLTNDIQLDFDGDRGGTINIDYHVVLGEIAEGRNTLNIDVQV